MYIHILEHSFFETLNLLPFLFLSYLFLEYIEHKSQDKIYFLLQKTQKFAPLVGSLLGIFPHCGFSAIASSLYATRVITIGTLFSVYLATSDEMIPIFLSEGASINFVFKLLFIKFLIALFFGIIIDLFFKNIKKTKVKIKEFCECENCNCNKGIIISSFMHTFKILLWVFFITFILGVVVNFIGEKNFAILLSDKFIFTKFITAGIGIIPNCASSVILSKLYLSGVISLSSLISGLLVGAGLGIIVLFKMNKNIKENICILLSLYFIAVIMGFILELFIS